MTELPANWSPKNEDQRRYYRDAQTGDRGYLVKRDGKRCIQLDRPNQEIIRRLDDNWLEEDATRPITPIAAARIYFEADKALCAALGDQEKGRSDWAKLTDAQRHLWMTEGPKRPMQRAVLYKGLVKLMEPYLGGR